MGSGDEQLGSRESNAVKTISTGAWDVYDDFGTSLHSHADITHSAGVFTLVNIGTYAVSYYVRSDTATATVQAFIGSAGTGVARYGMNHDTVSAAVSQMSGSGMITTTGTNETFSLFIFHDEGSDLDFPAADTIALRLRISFQRVA